MLRTVPRRQVFETTRNKWWAGTGLNRQHQDFQTRPHLPARTDDLFVSVMIRCFRRVDLACASGSGRMETHDSVRVEFESTRAVRTARVEAGLWESDTRIRPSATFRSTP